jgi:hypothetical protein
VIEENPVAFSDGLKMFLCNGVPNSTPHGVSIPQKVVKAVIGGFFFDKPIHH